jgi:aryl-alcohol dehydrogenase-like predicted oxidoreductase
MTLPAISRFQFTEDMEICRILNGMWQVSGGHGPIDRAAAVEDMFPYVEEGFTTWDLADHYGPAEDLVGEFRRRLVDDKGPTALEKVQAFTKWVPRPGPMTRGVVEQAVDVSLRRMDTDCLDLMQFHWWDYQDESYLDALSHLSDLRDEGKIKHVALTNFDTERLKRITGHGIKIVSNQVQFSLVDRRPEVEMVQFCLDQGIHLLAYGTLCGGLLSDKYLGEPEPSRSNLSTASLSKYKQMVDAWGGWALFQELLRALKIVADKHQVSVANVAVRYVIDRPAVAGAIVGVRLGASEHRADSAKVFSFNLDQPDLDQIEAILNRSKNLYQIIGDCGDEYRR